MVAAKTLEDVAFPPDPRPAGVRFQHVYAKLHPYPYERYEGKGFKREDKVDLKHVNAYHDPSQRLSKNKPAKKK